MIKIPKINILHVCNLCNHNMYVINDNIEIKKRRIAPFILLQPLLIKIVGQYLRKQFISVKAADQ